MKSSTTPDFWARYRAVAILQEDTFFWFWIGTHDEYERLVLDA